MKSYLSPTPSLSPSVFLFLMHLHFIVMMPGMVIILIILIVLIVEVVVVVVLTMMVSMLIMLITVVAVMVVQVKLMVDVVVVHY